jgi:hypothetical protein
MHPVKGSMDLCSAPDLLEAVAAIVSRHPVQEKELSAALLARFSGNRVDVERTMKEMFASGRFATLEQAGEIFWIPG